MSQARARIRVRITVELDAAGGWGDGCTIGQARSQAIDSATDALRRGLVINGTTCDTTKAKVQAKVVGEPVLTMTIVEDAS